MDGVEKSQPRSQVGILSNLGEVKLAPTDKQTERMLKMVLTVDPLASGRMASVAMSHNPDHAAVLKTVRTLLDSYARGSITLLKLSIVGIYLSAVGEKGSSNPATIDLLKQISLLGEPNWTPRATEALQRARVKAPEAFR